MSYSVNRRMALSTTGVAAKFTITAVPSGPSASMRPVPGDGTDANLTLNDATTLAAANLGNQIWSCPLSGLAAIAGQRIDLGTTTNGLVASAVPPGVGCVVEF
jgi:hypothetical protein